MFQSGAEYAIYKWISYTIDDQNSTNSKFSIELKKVERVTYMENIACLSFHMGTHACFVFISTTANYLERCVFTKKTFGGIM